MVDKVQKGKSKTCLVSSLSLGNKHLETFQNVTFHQNYHQHLYETFQRLLLYMVGIFIPFSSTPQNIDVEQQLSGWNPAYCLFLLSYGNTEILIHSLTVYDRFLARAAELSGCNIHWRAWNPLVFTSHPLQERFADPWFRKEISRSKV